MEPTEFYDNFHQSHTDWLTSLIGLFLVLFLIILVLILGFILTRCSSFAERRTSSTESLIVVPLTRDQLTNSISCPEIRRFPSIDDEQTVMSNSPTIEQSSPSTSLTFSLRWNEIHRLLFVRILYARNLHRRRFSFEMPVDSYVRLDLLANDSILCSMRTKIIKRNASPNFNEVFQFDLTNETQLQTNFSLLFTLLTHDRFTRDEILGEIVHRLDDLSTLNSMESIFNGNVESPNRRLNPEQLGEVLISICYRPVSKTLTLFILKASNLMKLHTTRFINPYIKIYVFYKGQRIGKRRTTTKRTTQSPVFNEYFSFEINKDDLIDVRLDLIVFDFDSRVKHQPIGCFSIGKTEPDSGEFWLDVCQRQPNKPRTRWFSLNTFE